MCRGIKTSVAVGQGSYNLTNAIKYKIMDIMKSYEEIIGVQEVRTAQKKVLDAKEKFMQIQEERREASRAVAEVQHKLKEIHSELDATTRGEDRYVRLITEENKILKEEKQLVYHFQQIERQERDFFSILSTAVTESHEKEREQADKVKYWSIIGSVLGTIFGIMGSSINNYFKMAELRKLLKESIELNSASSVPAMLAKHEKELSSIVDEMKRLTNSYSGVGDYLKQKLSRVTDKIIPQSKPGSVSDVSSLLKLQCDKNEEIFQQLKFLLSKSSQNNNTVLIDTINKQNSLIQKKLDNIYLVLYNHTQKYSQGNGQNIKQGLVSNIKGDEPNIIYYAFVGTCAILGIWIMAKVFGG